ncbi:MAG TPA: hypothetical protein VHF26_05310, partial [Trebonia sp.]|nr:hypothetical protein [Trebonia sp.]
SADRRGDGRVARGRADAAGPVVSGACGALGAPPVATEQKILEINIEKETNAVMAPKASTISRPVTDVMPEAVARRAGLRPV